MEALSALNGTPLDDVVAKHSDAASRILAAASVVDAAKSRLILCIERAVEDARASFGAVAGELAKATTTFKLQALRGQKYRSLWLEKGLEECDSVIKIIESVARLSRAPVGDLALVLDGVLPVQILRSRVCIALVFDGLVFIL